MEHPNIYRRAVVHYGEQRQLTKTLEELGALAAALARWMGSQGGDMRARAQLADHVSEEIADVEIMLAQVKVIMQSANDVILWKDRKRDRLAARIEGR